MVDFVRTSLFVLAAYGALGTCFALAFHLRGLHDVDAATRDTGVGFRLLITPGIIALWPLLVWRWKSSRGGGLFPGGPDTPFPARRLRAAHALAWKALAMAIPLIVAAALYWRPREAPSSRISVPDPVPSAAGGIPPLEPRTVHPEVPRHPGRF